MLAGNIAGNMEAMKPVSDTYHLQRRGDSWHYVRRVPSHLVPVLGKKFIKKSLGKVDKIQAKKLRTIEDLRCDTLFAEMEGKPQGSLQLIATPEVGSVSVNAVIEHVRRNVDEADKRYADWFAQDPPSSPDDLNDRRKDVAIELSMLQTPGDLNGEELVSRETGRAFAKLGRKQKNGEYDSAAAEVVRRGLVELARRRLERYDDRNDRTFHDVLFDPGRTSSMTFEQAADIHLAEKLKHYAENAIRVKSADRLRVAGAYLKELIGPTTSLADIDDDLVQVVREGIAHTPVNRNKFYPTLSLKEQIVRAAKEKRRLLSPHTQGFYLDCFRDIMQTAVRKRAIPFNPAADAKPLKLSTLTADEKRLPWTEVQLKEFFEGSFYRSCAPGAAVSYVRKDRSWRFWLPLLMLFSGARPNEILQLQVSDVKQTKNGTWYLDLLDEEGQKQLKTKSSRRQVPIHPEIIKCGFLMFVQERREAGAASGQRLFPSVRANKYGSYSDGPSKAFNRTFICKETSLGPRQALYSLRHNVRDALRRAQVPPEALRVCGWSVGKSVSDHYGKPGDPDLNAGHVASITYPNLDLSFLHLPIQA